MDKNAWKRFKAAREKYRSFAEKLNRSLPGLARFEQELVNRREGPSYTVETPVVYNRALDDIGQEDEIRLILVADNPGRREQAGENRRYLVGPSGKIAEKFFREHPELKIDFRKNVIILNKTPIHSPRTAELAELCRLGGGAVEKAVIDSQVAMADFLLEFHKCFAEGPEGPLEPFAPARVPVWIIGYSEMKKGGIFEAYTERIKELYAALPVRREDVFFYRHFSMNQFTIDLGKQRQPGETAAETLTRMGAAYRNRVMGVCGLMGS
jgi:hypothetical protein